MADIKLYGYATSPFVRKTAAFLYYKNLEFTHVPVNPLEPEKTLGHTGGAQVPVLEIDGEWRRESSDHALWLDELFPERPLCPAESREEILTMDRWINENFFPMYFRPAVEIDGSLATKRIFWRLAALVSAHTPMPEQVRNDWDKFVSEAPFIKHMLSGVDLNESFEEMQMRVVGHIIGCLGDGPFLCGLKEPSMLDFALFPQFVFDYMGGLVGSLEVAQIPVLKDWLFRVAEYLPANPILIPDSMVVRQLSDAA